MAVYLYETAMRYLIFCFSFLWLVEVTADDFNHCKPHLDLSHKNYLIGYGSLIETKSRLRTNPQARRAFPLELSGYERIWGLHAGHYKGTFLTLINNPKSHLNAVYYPVSTADIKAADWRESYYCRKRVKRQNIRFLSANKLPAHAVLWVYEQKPGQVKLPNATYPIPQSYVDIFVSGCLQIQSKYHLKDFARQCIATTQGWPGKRSWVNDRVYPRRPFALLPNAVEIDRLLARHISGYYDHPIE